MRMLTAEGGCDIIINRCGWLFSFGPISRGSVRVKFNAYLGLSRAGKAGRAIGRQG
jgi:hypothetical protein